MKCLLDSGCEWSVISADLAPNASLNPSQYTLFAANKANLDVLGDTVLPFVIDGYSFEADVLVCSKIEDFLLGSDWLEKQGAQWDFTSGTVTLGDRCIKVHRRNRTGICRHVVVASDCIVPAKHEANVLVRMEDDGLTLPPYDWAIEPQGLGLYVMTAHTLFSNSQPQLVAWVLNNSSEDKLLSADTFLSMAEPVQCLSDDGHKPASLMAKGDKSQYDTLFWGESASPVSSGGPSSQMSAGETVLHASSLSTAIVEATASSSSTPSTEGPQDHIESLLQRLPDDLTLDQKQRAETFIRSRANVFSRSEFDIGRTNIVPHRVNTGDASPHFEQLRRHPTTQLPVIDKHSTCWSMMSSSPLPRPGVRTLSWCTNRMELCAYALTIAS